MQTVTLRVANIPQYLSQGDISQVFMQLDGYLSCRINYENGEPIGYIDFSNQNAATAARNMYNNWQGFGARPLSVEVAANQAGVKRERDGFDMQAATPNAKQPRAQEPMGGYSSVIPGLQASGTTGATTAVNQTAASGYGMLGATGVPGLNTSLGMTAMTPAMQAGVQASLIPGLQAGMQQGNAGMQPSLANQIAANAALLQQAQQQAQQQQQPVANAMNLASMNLGQLQAAQLANLNQLAAAQGLQPLNMAALMNAAGMGGNMGQLGMPQGMMMPQQVLDGGAAQAMMNAMMSQGQGGMGMVNLGMQPDGMGMQGGFLPQPQPPPLSQRQMGGNMGGGMGPPGGPVPPNAVATLYVDQLPQDMSKRELAHIFRPFEGYKTIRFVIKDSIKIQGEKQKFGFVEFSAPEQATLAMNTLQDYPVDLDDKDTLCLRISYARPPKPDDRLVPGGDMRGGPPRGPPGAGRGMGPPGPRPPRN